MASSLYFYDLETSGTNPRTARIMQFAGQRTDMDLNPIGEPDNVLIKLTDDVLPEPDAVLVTGITPQQTLAEGITEAAFFEYFAGQIVQDGTIFIGFNNIRFDDEFIRYGLYRNFFDAYEWQWKNNTGRWDILDLTRMARALRPEGINWPFAPDGKPTNRLELLTQLNGLSHDNAHDALNDVHATIAVARLIKTKQPKLYDYAYSVRGKKEVEKVVSEGGPFVYVSGKYDARYEKLAVVCTLGAHADGRGVYVYDLRYPFEEFVNLSAEALADIWRWKQDKSENESRLPVKLLQFNRCPSIAPLGVIRPMDAERLQIDLQAVQDRAAQLKSQGAFYRNILKAAEILDAERTQTALVADESQVDAELYNGFIPDADKQLFPVVHKSSPEELSALKEKFKDSRLQALLPLYKARNFPKSLLDEERRAWERFRIAKVRRDIPRFMQRLQQLSQDERTTAAQQYLLEELHLYAESIVPIDE